MIQQLPRTWRRRGYRHFLAGTVVLCVLTGVAAATVPDSTAMDNPTASSPIESLLTEALSHNTEINAARAASDAAQQRIAPAGSFADPMLEAGAVNVPVPISFRSEDMTMKMLGLSQKLPFPGKRSLRRDVARAEATSIGYAVSETVDRVLRDVRVAYEELRLIHTSQRLLTETLKTVTQLVSMAEARYAVGQAPQSDPLEAQIEVVRLQQELLRLDQKQAIEQSELRRLLGRHEDNSFIEPTSAILLELPAAPAALEETSQNNRPQIKALTALMGKSDEALALARREFYPDFEVRLGYGQREPNLAGMRRDDMVTLTVAINLPIWRKSRLAPQVAEARAMQREASSMTESQRLETRALLEQQLAVEREQRASASLYRSTLVFQAHAAFDSALAAYRVGRVDFKTLLDARVGLYDIALGEAVAIATHNKAIEEIDLLTGRMLAGGSTEVEP